MDEEYNNVDPEIAKLVTVEQFMDKIDFNLKGLATCCSWLKMTPEEMKVIKRTIKMLEYYRDNIFAMKKIKDYKRVIRLKQLMEAKRGSCL
jgi:hypothetical protein